MATVTCT